MLPTPGELHFTALLVSHIQETLASQNGDHTDWAFEPSLFSTILLALIVGEGGVIVDVLRGRDKRRNEIARVVRAVQAITSGIFGLLSHHAHIRTATTPKELAYKILLNPPQISPSRFERAPSTSTFAGASRPNSRILSRSGGSFGNGSIHSHGPSQLPGPGRRSGGGRSTGGHTPTTLITPGVTPKTSFGALLDRPLDSISLNTSTGGSPRVITTELLTTSPNDLHEGSEPPKLPEVPEALVIDGLENAESPVWIKLCEIMTTKRVKLSKRYLQSNNNADKRGNGGTEGLGEKLAPALELVPSGEAVVEEVKTMWDSEGLSAEGMFVVWVRDEEDSEKCPSWLIDQFSCSVTVHPDDIEDPPELARQAIIPKDYIQTLSSLLLYTHIHPPLHTHTSNLLSAVSLHPRLTTSITSKTINLFPSFIRAHRLLSGGFELPPYWQLALEKTIEDEETSGGKLGLGGGRGGVDSWGRLAGEEPSLKGLWKRGLRCLDREPGVRDCDRNERYIFSGNENGIGNGGYGLHGNDGEVDEDDWDGEDFYAMPENVSAVFNLALRHRVGWRTERAEVMWLLKGSAEGTLFRDLEGLENMESGKKDKGGEKDVMRIRRRQRRNVDDIMDEMLRVV